MTSDPPSSSSSTLLDRLLQQLPKLSSDGKDACDEWLGKFERLCKQEVVEPASVVASLLEGEAARLRPRCTAVDGGGGGGGFAAACFRCGKSGHRVRECPVKSSWRPKSTARYACWGCGSLGHLLCDCVSPRQSEREGESRPSVSRVAAGSAAPVIGGVIGRVLTRRGNLELLEAADVAAVRSRLPIGRVLVDGRLLSGLVDTGSERTIVSPRVVEGRNLRPGGSLVTADGTQVRTNGCRRVVIRMNYHCLCHCTCHARD